MARVTPQQQHALAELGYALIREGRYDDARAIWEGLAHLCPHDEAPFRALAVVSVREKRWDDAVTYATAAVGRLPSAAALLLRAEALLRTGRYAEAQKDLEQILGHPAASDEEHAIRRHAAVLHARLRRPLRG